MGGHELARLLPPFIATIVAMKVAKKWSKKSSTHFYLVGYAIPSYNFPGNLGYLAEGAVEIGADKVDLFAGILKFGEVFVCFDLTRAKFSIVNFATLSRTSSTSSTTGKAKSKTTPHP